MQAVNQGNVKVYSDANQIELQKTQLLNQVSFLKESQLANPTDSVAAERIGAYEKTIKKLEKQLKLGNFEVVRTKKDILTSLQEMSKNFDTLSTELNEFKKDADTVQYTSVDGSPTQAEVQENFNIFQKKLNQATKSFEKIKKEVDLVLLFRLRTEKLESVTKGESNKKLLEDFTKLWSEIATISHRTQVDAKYVSLRIADLPKMEDLLAKMQDEAKRINACIYNPELSERKGLSYFVKEDQKVGFNDFVITSKKSHETLFSTLLEIGKANKETQEKITTIDEKSEYAAKLALSDNVQKELNIKNFAEISKLGNKDNKFLSDKYMNACTALFNANEVLNYENSYIQKIAADPSIAMPLRLTTYSITLNPNMKVDTKLNKIEVPVIVTTVKIEGVEDNAVKTVDAKTEEGTVVAQSSDIKADDNQQKV